MHPSPKSPGATPSRRDVLRHGLTASASLLLAPSALLAALRQVEVPQTAERPWLAVALKTERWLSQMAQRSDRGTAWPADPTDPKSVQTDLYTGMAGVVLFYLELHHATGDADALQAARGGADFLLASVPDEPGDAPMGLYTGLAGVATVLALAHRVTRDERYRAGVKRALSVIVARPSRWAGAWSGTRHGHHLGKCRIVTLLALAVSRTRSIPAARHGRREPPDRARAID